VLENTIRSSIFVRYRSAVSENVVVGRRITPMLALLDVSSFSGAMPKARVTALSSRAVSVSVSTPAEFRLVETEL
jgi:hypothetical protein